MLRLIELFAGIGSQAKALKNIGCEFEHHFICEFDKYAVTSYNAIHGTNFEPCDITQITSADLNIVDTDKHKYLLTYSFPCTDLSVAGKQAGMAKGDNTRSGLLWEVERLLKECDELPQILLMENVPQVHGKKNIEDFEKWLEFLQSLGYVNNWQDLNAKDYGVAQNRNRTFMVSILNDDRKFEFPKPQKLEKRLIDYLDTKVDKRFYLNEYQITALTNSSFAVTSQSFTEEDNVCRTLAARDCKQPQNVVMKYCVGLLDGEKWDKMYIQSRRVYTTTGVAPTVTTKGGGNQETKIVDLQDKPIHIGLNYYRNDLEKLIKDCNDGKVKVRKIIPVEYWRLMGFSDEDFSRAKTALNNTYYKGKDRSNSQLYKQAGNSIVVKVLERIFDKLEEI